MVVLSTVMGLERRTITYEVFPGSLQLMGSHLCNFVAKDGSREIVSTIITPLALGWRKNANGFLWYMYGQF